MTFTAGHQSRRTFLRRIGHMGITGVAAPWAVNLAAISDAAAMTATDYKALVCVFLLGGNDNGNTVIPLDSTHQALYQKARTNLALAQDSVLPLTSTTGLPSGMQFGLHPSLAGLQGLFSQGKMAIQMNVGPLLQPTTLTQYRNKSVALPPKLFSHNDQQSVWQSSAPEGAVLGWGGRLGDLAQASQGASTFTAISLSGNAVFLSGDQVVQYQINASGVDPIWATKWLYSDHSTAGATLRDIVTQAYANPFMNEHARVVARALTAESTVNQALAGTGQWDSAKRQFINTFKTTFPASDLGSQLQMVARLLKARSGLGNLKRQVFMVALPGFDLHDYLVAGGTGGNGKHAGLLADLDASLSAFYSAMAEMGMQDQVTAFTASDFGRTLTSNGDGSDHGWGSHHFVVGGAVKGGAFYGTPPSFVLNPGNTDTLSPDDVGQGRLLPSTSVDQYAATLAQWFGVSPSELPLVIPNIGRFGSNNLGFF